MTKPRKRAKPKGPFCGGKTRSGGNCTQPAGWGTAHQGVGTCKLHGGNAPAAALKGVIELARREQAVMGMPLAIEPQDAILECIRIAAGEVAYSSERIAQLEPADAVGPLRTSSVRRAESVNDAKPDLDINSNSPVADQVTETRHGPPALHVWIQVRRQAMDRLVQYSFAALKAGIEERRVRVAEQQGMLLAQAIQGILRELGVDQKPEAPAVVRKHLTLVAGQSLASDAGAA